MPKMMTVAEYEMILTLSEHAAKEYAALSEPERDLYWRMREVDLGIAELEAALKENRS